MSRSPGTSPPPAGPDSGSGPGSGSGSDELVVLLARVPAGWSEVAYGGATWGLTRTDRAQGGTTTLYAEQLGGAGLVSANVWHTSTGDVLKPCEMPAEVVLDFLRGWTPG